MALLHYAWSRSQYAHLLRHSACTVCFARGVETPMHTCTAVCAASVSVNLESASTDITGIHMAIRLPTMAVLIFSRGICASNSRNTRNVVICIASSSEVKAQLMASAAPGAVQHASFACKRCEGCVRTGSIAGRCVGQLMATKIQGKCKSELPATSCLDVNGMLSSQRSRRRKSDG